MNCYKCYKCWTIQQSPGFADDTNTFREFASDIFYVLTNLINYLYIYSLLYTKEFNVLWSFE